MEEKLSALMDGEADPAEAMTVLEKLKMDQSLQDRWHTYHLIGDVLRNDTVVFSEGFADGLKKKLSEEPTVLAPRQIKSGNRWFAPLAAAASVAAVAMVGLAVIQVNKVNEPPLTIAANSIPAKVVVEPAQEEPVQKVASSSTTVNPYLLAHQEYSPSTTMEGVVPYVRSVADIRQDSAE